MPTEFASSPSFEDVHGRSRVELRPVGALDAAKKIVTDSNSAGCLLGLLRSCCTVQRTLVAKIIHSHSAILA